MTRYEEIKEMAKTTACHMTSDKDMQVAFADALRRGAQWADRTMIDKACEWLKDFIEWNDLCTLGDIEQFRNAMEGD